MFKPRFILASLVICLLLACAFSQEAQTRPRSQSSPNAGETVKPKAAEPIQQSSLKFFLFTPQCFDKLTHGDIDIECIKFTISKLLSYGVIAGSLLYKAPQIIKVLRSGSVEGLSLSSFYFQLTLVIITVGYNLHLKAPLSTYAENISVFIQTFILIVLHWKFSPKTSIASVISSLIFFASLASVLFLELLPNFLYDGIGVINIILFFFAVFPQIKLNYQNKSTGQLAFITVFLSWAGTLARVFTTLQEVKDPLLLGLFGTGVFLNSIVLLQFFIYGGKKVQPKTTKKE